VVDGEARAMSYPRRSAIVQALSRFGILSTFG
jgi:hypothetical protein